MRISDWSSDVCSSDLVALAQHLEVGADRVESQNLGVLHHAIGGGFHARHFALHRRPRLEAVEQPLLQRDRGLPAARLCGVTARTARGRVVERSRSEEHTSELLSLLRLSYAVFCLQKKS